MWVVVVEFQYRHGKKESRSSIMSRERKKVTVGDSYGTILGHTESFCVSSHLSGSSVELQMLIGIFGWTCVEQIGICFNYAVLHTSMSFFVAAGPVLPRSDGWNPKRLANATPSFMTALFRYIAVHFRLSRICILSHLYDTRPTPSRT
ncbi:hypothetical protein VTL71DRAFT_4114 [Oculimacula yallundae]|uniref:Uncharacterized protein n=1 Tax=Oculimacula yallundae TaxID=86028 RepID=A0ABR4C4W5_9HELO